MRMVRVEKDRKIRLLALTFHHGGKLARTKELTLAFGSADEYRKFCLFRSCYQRLQQDLVRDIEMAEGCAFGLQPRQNIAQRIARAFGSPNCCHCNSFNLR